MICILNDLKAFTKEWIYQRSTRYLDSLLIQNWKKMLTERTVRILNFNLSYFQVLVMDKLEFYKEYNQV